MAMLAETRKKQKWSLNPRGSAWSNDSSKFGEKLLLKMGWTAGQGLGANQQGIKEHVKVKVKHDSKGLGFKDNDQVWVEVENDFSNLLSKLSSQAKNPTLDSSKTTEEIASDSPIPIEEVNRSLEEKSKRSKARVHYQKFTRGKDLSRYSKRDLECIFGVSTKSTKSKHEENHNFVPSGNMEEYFNKKKLNKGSKDTNSANDDQKESNISETNNGAQGAEESVSQKKKNKKSKKRKMEENGALEVKDVNSSEEANPDNNDITVQNNEAVGEENVFQKKKKSKKRKNEGLDGIEPSTVDDKVKKDNVFNGNGSVDQKETNTTKPANTEETNSQKKKNKKSKKRKNDENNDIEPDSLEVKDEVERKKRKHSEDVENNVVENLGEKEEQVDTLESDIKTQKFKKKKRKSKVEQNEVLLCQIDGNYDSSEVEEFVTSSSENFENNLIVNLDDNIISEKKNTCAVQIDQNNKKNTNTKQQNQKINEIKFKVASSSIAEWCKKNSLSRNLVKDPTKTVMKHINEKNEEVSKQIDDIVQTKISNYLNQVFNKKDRIANPARELKEKKKKMVEEDNSCVQFSGSNLTCITGYGCY
ncbi:hypothetical protein WDU94_001115 [Cyamophila willieti]